MEVEFVDDEIQKLVFGTHSEKAKELTPEHIFSIGNFCLKNPDFNRTRNFYILIEILRLRKSAFIYDQFVKLTMFFKNIELCERTKSRQLTDCLKAVPFLFEIQQFPVKNPDGSTYEKKVIFPDNDSIILLLCQYPKTGEIVAEIFSHG